MWWAAFTHMLQGWRAAAEAVASRWLGGKQCSASAGTLGKCSCPAHHWLQPPACRAAPASPAGAPPGGQEWSHVSGSHVGGLDHMQGKWRFYSQSQRGKKIGERDPPLSNKTAKRYYMPPCSPQPQTKCYVRRHEALKLLVGLSWKTPLLSQKLVLADLQKEQIHLVLIQETNSTKVLQLSTKSCIKIEMLYNIHYTYIGLRKTV